MNSSTILTGLLVLFFACPLFSQVFEPPMPDGEPVMPAEPTVEVSSPVDEAELTIQGTVTENVHDCAFDGDCYVVVQTDDGGQVNVIYTSGMLLGCPNLNLDPTLWDLAAGERVEAFGEVWNDGSIMVCTRDDYYLNRIGG